MAIEHRIKRKFATRNEEIIAALRTAVQADAPLDHYASIRKKTAELAHLMSLVHGGDWRVQIDHDVGLIVIAPR